MMVGHDYVTADQLDLTADQVRVLLPWVSPPNPLDAVLRNLVEQAPSACARAWARRLLEQGEAAASDTSTLASSPPQRQTGAD
jgi:hypothetical protein